MNRRTTFSLDSKTIDRIKQLAAHWHVSQAEVVRRAVERTEQDTLKADEYVLQSLREYREGGGIAREKADEYLQEIYEDRETWRE